MQDVKEFPGGGIMLMEKMQDRGIIAATFLVKSDKSRFEDLRVENRAGHQQAEFECYGRAT